MAFEHLMAYDGTSWQRIQIRTGADNLANTIQGLIANGFMYVYDGTTWDRLRGNATDGMLVNLGSNNDVSTELAAAAALADGASNPTTPMVGSAKLGFNGTTWDRWRNNEEVTLLASAVRSSTTVSSDQTNYNAKGVIIFMHVSVVPGTDTVQIIIEGKDPVSGNYDAVFFGQLTSGVSQVLELVYPGATDSDGAVGQTNDIPLPRTWRVDITHIGSGNFTYSVGASYIV